MFTIIKNVIVAFACIAIYNTLIANKNITDKPKIEKHAPKHRCAIDKEACILCKKKNQLNSERQNTSDSTKKELILFPKDVETFKENQVSIKTPEGKEEFRKQIGWLRDICDDYALEQYQKKNGIK